MKHLTVQPLKVPYHWSANSSNILESVKVPYNIEMCTLFLEVGSTDSSDLAVFLRYCVDNDKLFSVMNKIADIELTTNLVFHEFDLAKMEWWKYNPYGFRLVFSRKGQKNIAFRELRLNYYGELVK